ncbi:hypothetical protein CIHG_02378 [Coccidioides immitis H538.4]|uniref:Uncharacterized protein n=2 Tax=Coccidioides immitis TaxID=5501 RepID=A0A0J8RKV8_COCIT|nr:hypothetical protein CIRG_00544 [Coccidioides immitis RMSCC 2394]KMU84594.1 hypothetical protein CIHG_02378 [Coccidioides immitis H538.4]
MPKKGATNQKNKRKQRRKERYKGNKPVVTKSSQDEPPLEAYCFIEDESGTAPDYPMAVYSGRSSSAFCNTLEKVQLFGRTERSDMESPTRGARLMASRGGIAKRGSEARAEKKLGIGRDTRGTEPWRPVQFGHSIILDFST